MRKEQFIKYIENPMLLGEASIAELKPVVEAYPFFQTAHLLYAKALSNVNHVDYYSGLKKTSILAGDRKILYELITKTSVPAASLKEEQKTIHQTSIPEIQSASSSETEQKKNPEADLPEIPLVSNTVISSREKELKIDFAGQELEQEQRQINKQISDEKKDHVTRVELIVTPRQNEKEAEDKKLAEQQQDLPHKKIVHEEQKEPREKNVDEVVLNRVVNAYIEKEVLQIAEIDKPLKNEENNEAVIDPEEGKQILTATLNEPHSFSEWLKLLSMEKKPMPEKPVDEQEEINVAINISPAENENKPGLLPPEKDKKEKIIQKIISDEPAISKLKQGAEFFKPLEKARESIRKDETLVTETLAWILEKQGKYPEAIRAYETLSLKFPEKSVYFASLISKIKLKQKNK